MPNRVPVFALAQFCMALSWVVYAAFLPALAAQAGLPKSAVVWLLLADQVVFMLSDLLAGVASDRMAAGVVRWGQALGLLTGVAAIALLVMPLLAGAIASPVVLVAPALVWVACSSALRAPLFALLGKQARSTTGAEFRWLLLGSGVAAAMAPYLQNALKGHSPVLPFALVAASLVLCAVLVGQAVAGSGETEAAPAAEPVPALPRATLFFVALACAALALQIHGFFNSNRFFLREVAPEQLHWWLPAFWVGFNLTLLLPPLLGRWLPARRMGAFAALGALAVSGCAATSAAPLQAALQLLAGTAWAGFISTAFSTANGLGRPQRQGRLAGGVHATLAGASVLRLGMASAALPQALGSDLYLVPVALFAFAAPVLWFASRGQAVPRPI